MKQVLFLMIMLLGSALNSFAQLNLDIDGDAKVSGLTTKKDLTVICNSTFGGTTTMNGTFYTYAPSFFWGSVQFNAGVNATSGLNVSSGNTSVGQLSVDGNAVFLNTVTMQGTLTAFGDMNGSQDFDLNGNATVGQNLEVNGATTLNTVVANGVVQFTSSPSQAGDVFTATDNQGSGAWAPPAATAQYGGTAESTFPMMITPNASLVSLPYTHETGYANRLEGSLYAVIVNGSGADFVLRHRLVLQIRDVNNNVIETDILEDQSVLIPNGATFSHSVSGSYWDSATRPAGLYIAELIIEQPVTVPAGVSIVQERSRVSKSAMRN